MRKLKKIIGWTVVIVGLLLLLVTLIPVETQQEQDGMWGIRFVALIVLVLGWVLLRSGRTLDAPGEKAPKVAPAPTLPVPTPGQAAPQHYSTKCCPGCDETLPLDAAYCLVCGREQHETDSTCGSGSGQDEVSSRNYFEEERDKAKHAGITHYIWRTSEDGSVCERCRNNNGKTFSYDVEPEGGHAGARARCRCYPEPIISPE